MTKDKVQDYDSTAANNTDVGGANIAEGCAPSGINNAIRNFMSHIAAALSGADDKIITGTPGSNGNLAEWNADGDLVDGLAKSGADLTVITGTAGTDGNLVQWNADGDVVDGPDVLDEDDMASDSASAVPTQQSTKAYVGRIAAGRFSLSGGTPSWDFQEGFNATITDNGVGQFTLAFDAAEPDTDYMILFGAESYNVRYLNRTVNGFDVFAVDSPGTTATDPPSVSLMVMRLP